MSVVVLAAALAAAAPALERWHAELKPALAEAKASGKRVYLELSADWCEACVKLKSEVYDNPEGRDLLSRYAKVSVNVDRLERWNYEGFGTANIPTAFILDAEGREISRITGYERREDFLDLLRVSDDPARLEGLLRSKLSERPAERELREQLHTLYVGTRRYAEARALAAELRLSTSAAGAYQSLRFTEITGPFNARPQDLDEALSAADAYLAEFPAGSYLGSVLSYKARALWALGRREQSAEIMRPLPGLKPDESSGYWRLLEFSRLHGALKPEAEAALKEAVDRFSSEHYVLYQAALWQRAQGRKKEAARLLRRAAALDPSNRLYPALLQDWR